MKRQPIPFGKYLLLDRINIGGMAEVWRGKTFGAGGFERLVAIKRILPNIAEDEEFISMFIDEAKITVQLNHANIAQIYELSHIASSYFIAMEYIPGKDMRAIFDRCRKKGEPAPIPLTCYVVAKCCEGLDYAHRKQVNGRDMNIVHRDVSPQNVLISYEGEVKVIDFGIAKAAGKATKTQAGILKGKFGYMSPEQIRGLPLDRRSDVFAIGVCLYEMLTGERLFVGDSDFSVLEKVRKVEVLPPSTYNRKIPEGLEKIVMKALAKDVDDRYQYASEVADDLQRFLITSESIFSRKDLAQYMKSTFAEEVEREKQRILEYTDIKAPEGMLAAAEVSYGVGQVPAMGGMASTPSAVTNIPTVTPSAPTMVPTAGPGATRSRDSMSRIPPVLAPVAPPPSAPQPAPPASELPALSSRGGSGPQLPRLTAAAPMLTNGKEDNSTQLVDGDTLFQPGSPAGMGPVPDESENGESATVAMESPFRGRPAPGQTGELATDPLRQAVSRSALGLDEGTPVEPIEPVSDMTMPPQNLAKVTVVEPPRNNAALRGNVGRRPTASRLDPVPVDEGPSTDTHSELAPPAPPPSSEASQQRRRRSTNQSMNKMQPVGSGTGPAPAVQVRQAAPVAGGGSNKVLVALIGLAVLLLAVAVTAMFVLKPAPTGLLLIDVPPDSEVIEVNVNGEKVTEKDGTAVKSWPHLHQVKAGTVGVLIKVKGYEPLVDSVTVKEGGEVTRLSKTFQKAK